jgi:hypothetical protein
MARNKLVLKGFQPIKGDKARRAINNKTGEVISRREYSKRASLVETKTKPVKKRETAQERRARWYANSVNRQNWLDDSPPEDYISFEQAKKMPEFQYFESLIRSRYEEDRDTGYDFFDQLEQEFMTQDWGETP